MGLGDITGVFSRYFIVGFFLPAYASLVALWISSTDELIPNEFETRSETTQLLILGGIALVSALALSGSSYLITRTFEGYPLLRLRPWPVLRVLPGVAIRLQRKSFSRLVDVRDDPDSPQADRSRAAWVADRFFPKDEANLLPTRLGNAMRAFERHSNERWGLDGVTIWPRIDALLSSEERERHVDAKIDLYVFMNGALGAAIVGVCLLVDKAFYGDSPALYWLLYAIPFAVAYALYRATLAPAANWGDVVRASIDVHRLELYEKLGVRQPSSFSDEREIAVAVNKALLFARPLLPDDLWRAEDEPASEGPEAGGAPTGHELRISFRRPTGRGGGG